MYFEDFRLGDRFAAGPRVVTEQDRALFTEMSGDRHPLHVDADYAAQTRFGEPILQGSFGAAVAGGLWSSTGVVDDSVVAGLGESWQWHRPIRVGDELTLEVVVVGLIASKDGTQGTLERANVLRDAHGRVVQSGSAKVLIAARETAVTRPEWAVGSVAWGKRLAETLGADDSLADELADWDGTIGVRCGDDEVHLRIYRGTIVDVTRRAPHGSTFTFGAPRLVWAELLSDDAPDFPRRLMTGAFDASGDPYEYLRLMHTLEVIVDAAHRLADVRQEVVS